MSSVNRHAAANTHDVAVIGAGIVGLAVARELHRQLPALRLLVIDRENSVGQHQTGHNSGVIHSGVYYQPGSLKARLCVAGAQLMYQYCDAHAIPYDRCGKLIVALHDSELSRLDELERRGHANGVPELRRIGAQEISAIEPGCRGIAALHSPSTGIVDYQRVARAMATELRDDGVAFRLGTVVCGYARDGNSTILSTSAGPVRTAFVIGCAGLWSDRLARMGGAPADPRIVAFRGAYLTLKPTRVPIVRGLVYPVPDPELPFLGVHVTRHIDGRVIVGPTAMAVPARDGYRLRTAHWRDVAETLLWPGTWRLFRRFWRSGLDELLMAMSQRRLLRAAAQYVPAIGQVGVLPDSYAGVRAQALGRDGALVDDFVISETPGAIHVRNAPSPAATSSLALAKELVERFRASPQWAWKNDGSAGVAS